MLICSVSCKDETNHLLIIQAKWRPPEAERGHGLIALGMRGGKALGDLPHLQYRGPVSHFALCQLEKDESALGIPY